MSTKVTLAFDLRGSSALSDEEKRTVFGRLAGRINKEGILQIASQRTRSQELNREDVVGRFQELLRRALTPQQPRVKTRVPAASRHRRLEKKRKRAVTKHSRSGKGWDS